MQGLSHARNRGIVCAHGNIILFTDDDVLPEPDWLEAMLTGIEKHKADACGGFIAPIWKKPPPPWLIKRFYGFLALWTEGGIAKEVRKTDEFLFGANMAFRRHVFDRLNGFDTCLGRKGKILAGGEELDMFRRIRKSGGKICYLPKVKVHHYIEAFRMHKSYFRRWRFQASRNLAEKNGAAMVVCTTRDKITSGFISDWANMTRSIK